MTDDLAAALIRELASALPEPLTPGLVDVIGRVVIELSRQRDGGNQQGETEPLAAVDVSTRSRTKCPYLTVQEVAGLARCEHKAVRRAISDGRLRAFRPANRLLIRHEDALAWIEGCIAALAAEPPSLRRRTSAASRAVRGGVADLKAIERQVTAR